MPNHFHLMVYVKEVEVELEIESDSLSSRGCVKTRPLPPIAKLTSYL
jgi:hypothetical protein